MHYIVQLMIMLACTEFLAFVFQDLNLYLEDKVYLARNQITLADILMYYGIHPVIVSYLPPLHTVTQSRFLKDNKSLKL